MLSGMMITYYPDKVHEVMAERDLGRLVVNSVRIICKDDGRKPDLGSPALLLVYLWANVEDREAGGGEHVCFVYAGQ